MTDIEKIIDEVVEENKQVHMKDDYFGKLCVEKSIERIKKNVNNFLIGRYLVCSGDKYRLNKDDHRRLNEILDGRDLSDDENPYT